VREEVEYVTPKIRELMTTALLLPRVLPLEVEVGTGGNWLKAY
jgi:DNA polymerase-1